jgi:hypothetical protein
MPANKPLHLTASGRAPSRAVLSWTRRYPDPAMYEVDGRDRVTELVGVPQSSVGAPIPLVISDEHRVVLGYYVQETEPGWDGTTARIVGPSGEGEPNAIVRFKFCYAHIFGPPMTKPSPAIPWHRAGCIPTVHSK